MLVPFSRYHKLLEGNAVRIELRSGNKGINRCHLSWNLPEPYWLSNGGESGFSVLLVKGEQNIRNSQKGGCSFCECLRGRRA